MTKKTNTIKKTKNKNKNKNINKIIVNVNSNNKRKTVQGQNNRPQNNHMPMPIYFNSQGSNPTPIQNDIGIGYHKLLDGFSNRISTLMEEN